FQRRSAQVVVSTRTGAIRNRDDTDRNVVGVLLLSHHSNIPLPSDWTGSRVFLTKRTPDMIIFLSTALHISYMVSNATATPTSASISTPVCATVCVVHSTSAPSFVATISTFTWPSGTVWQSGMSCAVCL